MCNQGPDKFKALEGHQEDRLKFIKFALELVQFMRLKLTALSDARCRANNDMPQLKRGSTTQQLFYLIIDHNGLALRQRTE